MHAITSPAPEPPISFTPLAPIDDQNNRRWLRIALTVLAILGALALGLVIAPQDPPAPSATVEAPDLATNLAWMFDAALGHEATYADGSPADAALSGLSIESVEILDGRRGPIMAIVSTPSIGLAAYEITVTRSQMDWAVTATRLREP